MTSHEHEPDVSDNKGCECAHDSGTATMCVCDHNPGAECHCPPFESKCDQQHHLHGAIQTVNTCCNTNLPPN